MVTASELPIDTSATAEAMARLILGDGTTYVSASYTGAASASGTYTDGLTTAPNVVPSDTGVILSTGKATDITHSSGDPNHSESTTTRQGTAGDSDLDGVSGQTTYDAAVLNATFIPDYNTLSIQLVFSSEEYLEYVNSGFNDAVGVWVNGSQVQMSVGSGDISIDNINTGSNSNLFVDNPRSTDLYNTEMDGLTVTLNLKAPVNVGQQNTIKIGIADAGDRAWDSNLMISGNGVQTGVTAGDDEYDLVGGGTRTVDLLANDTDHSGGTLTITKINGQSVSAGDTVTLSTGQQIQLNADGTITIINDNDVGEQDTFSYTVEDADGNTDSAFVELTTVPCFVRGTRIVTADGTRPIETLRPGDLVLTLDHGLQPLRWIGRRQTIAKGSHAPTFIRAGTLGPHGDIQVSPQHRIMVSGPRAELLFGHDEVLVRAQDLVDDIAVTRVSTGKPVEYVHILFDRHEIVLAEWLTSESFYPGDHILDQMEAEVQAEIFDLFPSLRKRKSFGQRARPALKSDEARALFKTRSALSDAASV